MVLKESTFPENAGFGEQILYNSFLGVFLGNDDVRECRKKEEADAQEELQGKVPEENGQ